MADNPTTTTNPKYLDLGDFKEKLSGRQGRQYWRSLEELAGTDEFRELMHREFPKAASEWDDNFSRRNFLKLMGASLALAGVTAGCGTRKREEKLVPYVQQPEQLVPGKPLFFATTFPMDGFGRGVLVEQHEGRPTKIEGNPDHPASLGASNVFMQASVLQLYDPDRAQAVTRLGNTNSWGTFLWDLQNLLRFERSGNKVEKQARKSPLRVRVLTETVTSPTLAAQMVSLREVLPELTWHTYDPIGRANSRAATKQVLGRELAPVYRFEHAKVVVSLDSNFLFEDAGSIPYARNFMKARGVDGAKRPQAAANLNRLYVIESAPTITGTTADNTLRLSPAEVGEAVRQLARALGVGGGTGETTVTPAAPATHSAGKTDKGASKIGPFVAAAAADLRAAGGYGVVVAGEYQPPEVHALAYAMNAALGSIGDGKPLGFIRPPEANPGSGGAESLRELVRSMGAGEVDLLLILGGNPVYAAPADIDFAAALKAFTERVGPDNKGGWSVRLGLYADETSRLCQWHLPEAHYLEAWGDVRAFDGTASVIQPLIAPLYEGRSAHELLGTLLQMATDARQAGGGADGSAAAAAATQPATQPTTAPATQPGQGSEPLTRVNGYDIVRGYWRGQAGALAGGQDFEAFWNKCLTDGVIHGTAFKAEDVSAANWQQPASAPTTGPTTAPASPNTLTLVFRPDPTVWDGSFANNPWLQECPKPLTKLTWDNAVIISPATARALGVLPKDLNATHTGDSDKITPANGRLVTLSLGGRSLPNDKLAHPLPLWILPGHPDGCATLYLGYGREVAGHVGTGTGFNAYALRTSANPWAAPGATLTLVDGRYPLATTQQHQLIETHDNKHRGIALHGTSVEQIYREYLREKTPQPLHKAADAELERRKRLELTVLPDDPRRSPWSLYPGAPDQGTADGSHNPIYPAWAMVIDMTACIGCNACVVACQSENNIPVVGKDQVLGGRNMHWIRVDTYFVTEHDKPDTLDEPEVVFQPLPCMHCEKAPCEVVCPVAATTHSAEGLNEMTYNRCVGTRYCSNNCPYKVRRFNFLQYTDNTTPVLKLGRNPDVTVRNRGVMEKCTYCVQRINHARINGKKFQAKKADATTPAEKQKLDDLYREAVNSVVTACAQACPTQAIVFGNINPADNPAGKESLVVQLRRQPTNYGLLDDELQTRPRTTYLARINNPNPALKPDAYKIHGPAYGGGGGHDAGHGSAGHGTGGTAPHGGNGHAGHTHPATGPAGHGSGGAHAAPEGPLTLPATQPAAPPAAAQP